MRYPKWTALIAVIIVLSLAALACGGGGGAPPTDTPVPTKAPKATSTPEPVVEPTKAPKPTATKETAVSTDECAEGSNAVCVLNTYSYIDNYDYVHVVGVVINYTNDPVTNIEMSIELLDASGKSLLVGSDGNPADSLTFYPILYTLDPGQDTPFDYWTSTDAGEPDTYTVGVTNYDEGSTDRGDIALENSQSYYDADGNGYFSGELVNNTDAPVQINSFAVAATNEDGTMVYAADYTFSITRYLWPAGDEGGNDRTPFSATLDGPIPDEATHWYVYWDADIADAQDASGIELDITNAYFDTYGSFHMVGTAYNTGTELMSVALVAGLYDADGVVLDAQSNTIPVYVGPDETVPWHISYFSNVNSNQDESDRIDSYTVQVDRYWTYETSFETVTLVTNEADDNLTDEGDGLWSASGTFTNDSGKELSSAIVIVAIYTSADDTLVAMDYTGAYPEGDAIKDGDTLNYEFSLYTDPEVSANIDDYYFVTYVQGYVK